MNYSIRLLESFSIALLAMSRDMIPPLFIILEKIHSVNLVDREGLHIRCHTSPFLTALPLHTPADVSAKQAMDSRPAVTSAHSEMPE